MAAAERQAQAFLNGAPLSELPVLFDIVVKLKDVSDVARGAKALLSVLVSDEARQHEAHGDYMAAFFQLLRQLMNSAEPTMQVFGFRLSMEALAVTGDRLAHFLNESITEIVFTQHWGDHIASCILEFSSHADLRYFLLRKLLALVEEVAGTDTAKTVAGRKRKRKEPSSRLEAAGLDPEEFSSRVIQILCKTPGPSEEASEYFLSLPDNHKSRDPKNERALFRNTWLRVLQLPMSTDCVMQVLQHLPANVFPHLANPLLVSNFYLTAFDKGSLAVSVLSLSGLFYLLTKHQLGDPDIVGDSSREFYGKLFDLMSPEVFQLKYRVRFLRLMHLSLRSTLLPSAYVAAFVKKSARVAVLCESPAATMWLLVHIYSLMQRHKTLCYPLLHKGSTEAMQFDDDPFQPTSLAEAGKQVQETSLWELELLKTHYCPAVVRLANLFDMNFFTKTARRMDHEDFLDLSFDKLFQQELQVKKWATKAAPPVAFEVDSNDADAMADLAFESH